MSFTPPAIPAAFTDFMQKCLPPINGRIPVIASFYNSPRTGSGPDAALHKKTNNVHGAIDFNYKGGPPANPFGVHPVYCPIDGTNVTLESGRYGQVKFLDSKGFQHGFLHMTNIKVKEGGSITAGQIIGYVGNVAPFHLAVHLHYQIKNLKLQVMDGLLDPIAFWAGTGQAFASPDGANSINDSPTTNTDYHKASDPGHANKEPDSPEGHINEFKPRQAGLAVPSGAIGAVWTNRVPGHEPWARTMMVDTANLNDVTDEHERNTSHNPQYTETDEIGRQSIGKVDGELVYVRGPFWRR